MSIGEIIVIVLGGGGAAFLGLRHAAGIRTAARAAAPGLLGGLVGAVIYRG